MGRVAETAHKAPGGLIRVAARVRNHTVDAVELSGDFVMVPATGLGAIEEALTGCPIEREALERAVAGVCEAGGLQSPGVDPADIATALLALSAG